MTEVVESNADLDTAVPLKIAAFRVFEAVRDLFYQHGTELDEKRSGSLEEWVRL